MEAYSVHFLDKFRKFIENVSVGRKNGPNKLFFILYFNLVLNFDNN